MMSTRALTICLLSFFCIGQVSGQLGERYTEAEIQFQYDFLTAKSLDINDNPDKAIESLKALYDQDRTKASVAFELSKAYLKKENLQNALNYGKIAVTKDDSNQYYHQYLADLYEKNYEFGDAASVYQGLLDKFPENRYYYEKLAYNHLASGNPPKAIAVLDILEQKTGISEAISRRKYDMYRTLGNDAKAELELIALSNDSPEETRYMHNLALFYESIGDKQKQKEVYTKILKLDPDDGIAMMNASKTEGSTGSEDSFLSSLKTLYANPSIELVSKLTELVPLVEKMNAQDTAMTLGLLELTQILTEAHPEQAPVYAIQGDIYSQSNNNAEAIKNYKKTIELDDRVYSVWSQLMYALLEEKEYAELNTYGEKSLYVFPNQPLSYFMIAKANILSNSPEKATDYIMEGMIISGKNEGFKNDFKLLKAETLIISGDTKKAIDQLDLINTDNTVKNYAQYEVLGDLYQQAKADKKAIKAYKQAIKEGNKNPEIATKIAALEK